MLRIWIGVLLLILLAVAGVTVLVLTLLCGRLQRQLEKEREGAPPPEDDRP